MSFEEFRDKIKPTVALRRYSSARGGVKVKGVRRRATGSLPKSRTRSEYGVSPRRMGRSVRACKCGRGRRHDTNEQRAHGLRLLRKGRGSCGMCARDREARLTALVARVIAWADGRRLG